MKLSADFRARCVALATTLLLFATIAWPLQAAEQRTTRLLTVGNSFANNAVGFLPALAEAGGKKIKIGRANLPGASFKRHADAFRAYEANAADPAGKPYRHPDLVPPVNDEGQPRYSLQEILGMEPWDYITIQQQSWEARDWNTYEPDAGELIAYIRQHAPQAEILVLQTWAYRGDHPDFESGEWNQARMFAGLVEAYRTLAKTYRLRVIPVGKAFQLAREWRPFRFPDPDFDYKNPQLGTGPKQTGSLVIGWTVRTDRSGRAIASYDGKHANIEGQYLGACVVYHVVFGADVTQNRFVPAGISPADAAKLRSLAREAASDREVTSVRN